MPTDVCKAAAFKQFQKVCKMADGLPWVKGWESPPAWPVNFMTGKPYRGGNLFYLWIMSLVKGGNDARFAGMGQAAVACNLEGLSSRNTAMVREGCNGISISYPRPYDKRDRKTKEVIINPETGKPERSVSFGWCTVFHISDFVALDESKIKVKVEKFVHDKPNETFETVCNAYPVGWKHDNRAVYYPTTNTIGMPAVEQFKTLGEYYRTKAHELIHATAKLLERETAKRHETEKYSEEELVAEIGAFFLTAMLQVPSTPDDDHNTAVYIAGWESKIKDDPEVVNRAASKAWKAVEHVIETAAKMGVEIPTPGEVETVESMEEVAA